VRFPGLSGIGLHDRPNPLYRRWRDRQLGFLPLPAKPVEGSGSYFLFKGALQAASLGEGRFENRKRKCRDEETLKWKPEK
jgi:hypothetical protein